MPSQGEIRDGAGAGFELIETMRWEPGAGFVRLDRHLARLEGSARTFGFAYDAERIGEVLKNAVAGSNGAHRMRLVLPESGKAEASVQPYQPLPPHTVWKLGIAQTRLSSADALLRHKTSRRETFVAARAEFEPREADEVLLLNERGEVCEGTITSVFVETDGGMLLTPALTCGLLLGVLRAELLAEGRAREAVLMPADLMEAQRLFVGNSLRGLIPARMGE